MSVVVSSLNHIAHLIRHRYVVPMQLLLLYSPSRPLASDSDDHQANQDYIIIA